MSGQNSNLPPSYNSNIELMDEMTRHGIDFQRQIINKDLLLFENLIKKKYGKLNTSFLCNYHILNKIRLLLEKKFNKTISKNEKKLLHNLQTNLDKFIDLDIQHIFVLRQHKDTIKKLKKKKQELLSDNSIPYLKTLLKKNKKIAKDKFIELRKELSYLHDLEKILQTKLNSIYEQFTILLNSGTLLLNENGNHFLDNTNFMEPSLNLHYNDNNNNTLGIYNGIIDRKIKIKNKTRKKYIAKPPSYKHSQRTRDIERNIFNKWRKIIKSKHNSNSYFTANEYSFHTANENKSNSSKKQKTKNKKQKTKLLKKNKKHSHKPPGKRPKYYNSN